MLAGGRGGRLFAKGYYTIAKLVFTLTDVHRISVISLNILNKSNDIT